jgi:hypothetical protein
MKVTAFIGSARKKHTYHAAEKVLQKLQSFGDTEYGIYNNNKVQIPEKIQDPTMSDKGY